MNKIYILTTGGTISAKKATNELFTLGEVSGKELYSSLTIPKEYEIVEIPISAIDSSFMTYDILQKILEEISKYENAQDTKGFIITHGTDTLEESAYFLQLTYQNTYKKPVIVTGSQRAVEEIGSDALSNLQHAIYALASEKLAGINVSVLFNQCLLNPKYVHKSHTHFLHAFQCANYGMFGTVDNSEVTITQVPMQNQNYFPQLPLPIVEIYKASLDCSGEFLDYLINSTQNQTIKGLVIEAFGRGNVPVNIANKLERVINSGVTVVITSDCANGSIKPIYDFAGGLQRLLDYGAINGTDHSAKKARIKLAILLSQNKSKKEIEEAFKE